MGVDYLLCDGTVPVFSPLGSPLEELFCCRDTPYSLFLQLHISHCLSGRFNEKKENPSMSI